MDETEGGRDHPVDREIRRGLAPEGVLLARVSRGALEGSARGRQKRRVIGLGALTAAAVLVSILLWPDDLRKPSVPMAPGAPAPCLEIRSVGDLVVVRSPTGQVLAMTSGGAS